MHKSQAGSLFNLVFKPCEYSEHRLATNCLPWLAPSTISTSLHSYFRNPACVADFKEWHTSHPAESIWTWTEWQNNAETTITMPWDKDGLNERMPETVGCCDDCVLSAGNVDVYYWPVKGANTDCVSLIGSSYRPVDEGFFTYDARGHKEFLPKPNPWSTDKALLTSRTPLPNMVRRFHAIISPSNSSMALNMSMPINSTILPSTQIFDSYTL